MIVVVFFIKEVGVKYASEWVDAKADTDLGKTLSFSCLNKC
jgi:hypothetical protein